MTYVLGLVGENGAGKSTIARRLMAGEHSPPIQRLSVSDMLGGILTDLELPHTRENLQRISVSLRNRLWASLFSEYMEKQIKLAPSGVVIVFDAVRTRHDVDIIRSSCVNNLVFVTADPRIRFERLRARAEKSGEADLTWETFLIQEQSPAEVEIGELGRKAEFRFENNGTVEEFQAWIDGPIRNACIAALE